MNRPGEDEGLDAVLAQLKADTETAPSPALRAAVLAAAPRAAPSWRNAAAGLAACAVFGLAVGLGSAQFAPPAAADALDADAVISEALGAVQEGAFDG